MVGSYKRPYLTVSYTYDGIVTDQLPALFQAYVENIRYAIMCL
ncbi:hypothetical protein [Streptomyces lunaelactis]|nr:hypothetical protein [Streptomyces lunaelactis]